MLTDPAAGPVPRAPWVPASDAPVAARDRIVALDVLRGLALFGILVVNLQSFRGAEHPVVDHLRFPGAVQRAAEVAVDTLASASFFPLFSFLFGYGLVVQRSRAGAPSVWGWRIARRQVALGVLGLLHGTLLFAGDILLTYALAGSVSLAFAALRLRTLVILGSVLVAGSALWWSVVAVGFQWLAWQDGRAALIDSAGASDMASSSFVVVTGERSGEFLFVSVAQFFTGAFTMVLGMMLLGLAAGRAGLFARVHEHREVLVAFRRWGLGLGLPMSFVGSVLVVVLVTRPARGATLLGYSAGVLFSGIGSTALTFGYLGAVGLVRRAAVGRALLLLVPPGRMALTCYLGQSLVCSLLFSGYGLGWYGSVGPAGSLAIAVGLYVVQVVACHLWLRVFAIGPVEWALRGVTYLRVPRLLRGPS